jgi:hypothetical protein
LLNSYGADIRQLTDVLHRNLQHYLSCSPISQICALAPGTFDSLGGIMTGICPSSAGTKFLTIFELKREARRSRLWRTARLALYP